MISPTPMRQVLKSQYEPEQELYTEDEWDYPIAVHGMVYEAEEETQRVMEWQELFGKYRAPTILSSTRSSLSSPVRYSRSA